MNKQLLIWGAMSPKHKDCLVANLLKRSVSIRGDQILHKENASFQSITTLRQSEAILNILITQSITEFERGKLESAIAETLRESEEVVLVSFHPDGNKPKAVHSSIMFCTTLDMVAASIKFPGKKLSKCSAEIGAATKVA